MATTQVTTTPLMHDMFSLSSIPDGLKFGTQVLSVETLLSLTHYFMQSSEHLA